MVRIGIVGYGNLGRGVELAIGQNPDMDLVGIFTRRPPSTVTPVTEASVYSLSEVNQFHDKIDVMILCGGSKSDLPEQGPELARMFHTIDSFDTHAKVPEYFSAMDSSAKASQKLVIISVGWDPGLFSINRVFAESVLPVGETHTFWGSGVSQGHSDAIRRVPGVKAAVQYTVPVQSAVDSVRKGGAGELSTRDKHTRECFVAIDPDADATAIENAIVSMPDYFADYDTTVTFVTEDELQTKHGAMPHGGFVIRSGQSASGSSQTIEFSLKLESNPEFTASVLVAYARAAARMAEQGQVGAKTVFDVPPGLLSQKSAEQLRAELL